MLLSIVLWPGQTLACTHNGLQACACGRASQTASGGDAYILSQIVHDWDDARSLAILKTCRRAIGPTGKLLLVEMVITQGNEPVFGKFLDLHMLAVAPGGKERTEAEYRALLAQAGFQLTTVVPTQAGSSMVEAKPM